MFIDRGTFLRWEAFNKATAVPLTKFLSRDVKKQIAGCTNKRPKGQALLLNTVGLQIRILPDPGVLVEFRAGSLN